jgi:hypothetical protein
VLRRPHRSPFNRSIFLPILNQPSTRRP